MGGGCQHGSINFIGIEWDGPHMFIPYRIYKKCSCEWEELPPPMEKVMFVEIFQLEVCMRAARPVFGQAQYIDSFGKNHSLCKPETNKQTIDK
jgi:hypothetical protein